MKFTSLLPWLQKNPPSSKGILFFGSQEQLISYRIQFLQKYYVTQDFQIVRAESVSEVLDYLYSCQSLFESGTRKQCIIYQNITDTLANNNDFMPALLQSPHILLMSSGKLNSRAKLVTLFQSLKETAIIPCYDIDLSEISQSVSFCAGNMSLSLDPLAQQYLSDFLSSRLEEFFSTLEMLALYSGTNSLGKSDINAVLKEFSSSRMEDFNQYFFLGDISALNTLLNTIEPSEWISLVRQILQDLIILLSLQIHQAAPSSLRDFWSKGIVKFSYSRVTLYQKCLGKWPLKRCGFVLEQLLALEAGLKSSPSLSMAEIHHFLSGLSREEAVD